MFLALRLFPALRLFQTLEYVLAVAAMRQLCHGSNEVTNIIYKQLKDLAGPRKVLTWQKARRQDKNHWPMSSAASLRN